MIFESGEPLQFDTLAEAKKHIEQLKLLHPEIAFKPRKWLSNKNHIL